MQPTLKDSSACRFTRLAKDRDHSPYDGEISISGSLNQAKNFKLNIAQVLGVCDVDTMI